MCRRYKLGSFPSLASKTNCKEWCLSYTVNSSYVEGRNTKASKLLLDSAESVCAERSSKI